MLNLTLINYLRLYKYPQLGKTRRAVYMLIKRQLTSRYLPYLIY